MNIKRLNCDFGNSTNNFMVDGYYFELPTNVVEITQQRANKLQVNSITDPKELLERLVISIEVGNNTKYYLVGEMAELSKLSNNHVGNMHDKIKSIIPYLSFLSAIGYYSAINPEEEGKDDIVDIEYMSCMLPIWLLKRERKFSGAQQHMEERFIGQHTVKILTFGMERELKIRVKNVKCRIESEVARHAIKYKMVASAGDKNIITIEKRKNLEFSDDPIVLADIGGGSTDTVKLGKGLTAPQSRDSFQVIDIEPFLGEIEQLRKEKLLENFHDLRGLEKFIFKNYNQERYIFKDENTGKYYDFTDEINEVLKEYASVLVTKFLTTFVPDNDETIRFIYFGGETPILKPFIKQALLDHMTESAAEKNHLFLNEIIEDDRKEIFKPTDRTINLTALEILSIDEMAGK